MSTGRYINLFTDFGFKKVFGEEVNKDLLISFLNALLEDKEPEIISLQYLNNERLGRSDSERKTVYDLHCKNNQGDVFIVEIQRVKQQYFKDRSLYYSSMAITHQARRGQGWDYSLDKVYTISILDFCFEKKCKDPRYHHEVKLVDLYSKEVFYDKFCLVYLEVPKFDKDITELKTDFERWVYLFKNLHRLDAIREGFFEGVFLRVMEVAEIVNYNPKEQQNYQESLKDYWDLKGAMNTYLEKGIEIGREKGREKGLEEGVEKGKIDMVLNLLRNRVSIEIISKSSGLTIDEVEKLKNKL